MSNSISTQFLTNNTEASYLQEAFDALGVSHATASPHLILTTLSAILQHGIDIDFLKQLEIIDVQGKWISWIKAINIAIREYEAKTNPSEYQKDTYTYSARPKNKAINVLFYSQYEPQSTSSSSNTLGLKLIFLAILMLSDDALNQDDKKKIHHLFNLFIKKLRLFPQLNLDFTSDTSFDKIIDICTILVESKYKDPQKSDRQFLDNLKNALRLLQGYHLGVPNKKTKKPKSASAASNRHPNRRVARTVRHTPYYDPTDYMPDIGTFIEIVPEQGEESIIAIITPETEDDDDNTVSEELASAVTQVKTKYWLETFNEAIPWDSRGINPFTRSILIKWIKENDTITSLIFGLMLCVGRRFEDILSLEIGTDADITPDGIYIRSYDPPDNCFKPSSDQQLLVEAVTQTLRLPLPTIIKNRLIKRYIPDKHPRNLGYLLGIDTEHQKKESQKIIKQLIRTGATGLAIDRIHLALEKQLAEITGDEVIGYMLTGHQDNMPPVSAYYSSYPHHVIENIYRQAVEELYR